MKVEKLTKKQIIMKIFTYDSRFSKYLYTLEGLKKSVLINIYCFVLLNHISGIIVDSLYFSFSDFVKSL